ncbi:hypothetical protein DFJ74DRAFT_242318 [Hyaloraphidium curvatum]|nr:hypothetical protein DFJ74DRAFT_242318 [Hyaloraphidium curvatum]
MASEQTSALFALVSPPENASGLAQLPGFVPDSLDRADFQTGSFTPESFLAERRVFALEKLKTDLKNHLAVMKNELVELINQDYSDFINLSTNLVGVDKMIADLNKPLDKMKADVLAVRSSMQGTVDGLRTKLEKRTQLREKKSLLQLFLSIHESVGKVEALLGIESAAGSVDLSASDAPAAASDAPKKEPESELDLKLMERVAIEFNQLQFLVNRGKGLPFVQNLDGRIQRVQETLQTGMKKSLAASLAAFLRDRSDASGLTQCLRTYVLIDRTILAEDVIRETLYDPFLAKLISPTSLNFDPLLPVGVTPLQNLYQRILDFTAQEFVPLLEITERNLKGSSFQMLTHVVWVAVASAIQQQLPIIFAPGIPDAFHENYTTTLAFLGKLESFAPDAKALRFLRSHVSYVEFMRRWQTSVYFQIRFTAITTVFEDHVSRATSETVTASLDALDSPDWSNGNLLLPVSKALLEAISTSWADDVWLFPLSFRFWKLTLQCIGRFGLWLRSVTEAYHEPSPSGEASGGDVAPPAAAPAAPVELSEEEEQQMLNILIVLSYEVRVLASKLRHLFDSVISPKLPRSVTDAPLLETSLDSAIAGLDESLPNVASKVTSVMTRRCALQLQQIRNIPALYRRTNREPPTTPSYFVSQILKPLTAFCEANKVLLDEAEQGRWVQSTVIAVTEKYSSAADELLTTVRKTEDSLKRLKKQFKRPGASAAQEEGVSDEDKIRMQILLDVKQFGQEVSALGVALEGNRSYSHLVAVTNEQ